LKQLKPFLSARLDIHIAVRRQSEATTALSMLCDFAPERENYSYARRQGAKKANQRAVVASLCRRTPK